MAIKYFNFPLVKSVLLATVTNLPVFISTPEPFPLDFSCHLVEEQEHEVSGTTTGKHLL